MAKRKSRIQLRSGSELDGLREAGGIAASILRRCSEAVTPGITTGEIDKLAAELIEEDQQIEGFGLGFNAEDVSVISSAEVFD